MFDCLLKLSTNQTKRSKCRCGNVKIGKHFSAEVWNTLFYIRAFGVIEEHAVFRTLLNTNKNVPMIGDVKL